MNYSVEENSHLTASLATIIAQSLEALLFASSRPMTSQEMYLILHEEYDIPLSWIEEALVSLMTQYNREKRGFELVDIGGGQYVLRTKKEYSRLIERLHLGKRQERLSHSALETLACIAFRQPITRVEIDAIRGVDSSGVISHLIERSLIEVVGKKDAPGKPSLYATTQLFLTYFGIHSLSELQHRLQEK